MKVPLIGLALRLPSQKGHNMGAQYSRALEKAGAMPIMLPVGCQTYLKDYIAMVDGLILCGGGDADPALYGEEPLPQAAEFERAMDDAEIAAFHEARRQHKPIMGVCRGAQIINVALGGSLWQDIPAQVEGALCHRQVGEVRSAPSHAIAIEAGSLLHRILGKTQAETNSYHHQAVKVPGEGLIPSAHAADGVIEAIETADGQVLGLQWHPEGMAAEHEDMARLFTWFVNACQSK